jgi:hypothetical protein
MYDKTQYMHLKSYMKELEKEEISNERLHEN